MQSISHYVTMARQAALALLSACLCAAYAQSPSANDPCLDGLQDRVACEREREATQRQAPTDPSQQFGQNALRRCEVHINNPEARQACEDRVRGQNTRTEGSVLGGGIFQEQRTTVIEPARTLQ
ncbi:hypothetical protein E9531_05085 [Lampropedia puyangensis]|uniref:Secreted protein n=1 Tax=Lampropedia puyangensis TaxID=1330072 RepID=A0A4S8F9D2_9BURK|nr:hypothetical protein [Lampropedia puyangensis]THU04100.1 hypothetical protein E9531_05085 [Lampropedia puyangensis]